MLKKLGILFILGAILTSTSPKSSDWVLIKTANSVTVYKRNEPGSAIISLKGTTTIPASPNEILEILADNQIAGEWIPKVSKKVTLKQLSKTERLEVTYINMPWPVTNRYFVTRSKLSIDKNGTHVISVKTPEENSLNHEGMIAGKIILSEIILIPQKNGQTSATIEVNSDPKGMIPKWLINLVQKNWPVDFFTNLNEQLALRPKNQIISE